MKLILISDTVQELDTTFFDSYIKHMDYPNEKKLNDNLYLIYDDGYCNEPVNKLLINATGIPYQGDCLVIRAKEDWTYSGDGIEDITEKDFNEVLNELYKRDVKRA